jgi:hypothetical protein
METILSLLINSLQSILQVVIDLCESYMSHFGLIRWAFSKDPNTSFTNGTVGGWIFFSRYGKTLVRGRPSHFHIKNTSVWKNRWSKFSAFFNCARNMNKNLSSLYEGEQIDRSWFNTLCSQLSQFWVKQMDGTFLFNPGKAVVSIGNGTMPDARNVVFSSPSVNTLRINFDNTIQFPGLENNDDTLQLMFIDQNGQQSFWIDLISVTRSSGSATYLIPPSFGTRIYPAIKFKVGSQFDGRVKGIFRFPQAMQPVIILR